MKLAIFDFDGTIANTLEAMVAIYNDLAPHYRCKVVGKSDVDKLRNGRPKELMREFGISAIKLPFIIASVRRGLRSDIARLPPQQGVIEALLSLHAQGMTLGILTSNSKENVETYLQAHGLENVFAFVDSYRHLFGKHIALRKIMKTNGVLPSEVAYIGDEIRDVESAKKAGVMSIAVAWGFQTYTALESSSPDAIITTPNELLTLFARKV